MSAIEHEPGRIPSEAVELIKSLYVVEGAMAQDHGLDYLFGNIEILTALTRDMLHREASAKLAENNSGTDAPDGKDER